MSEHDLIVQEVRTLQQKLANTRRVLVITLCLPVLAVTMGQARGNFSQQQTEETARPAMQGELRALSNSFPLSNAMSVADQDNRSRLLIAPNQNGNICLYLYKNGAENPVRYVEVESLLKPYP